MTDMEKTTQVLHRALGNISNSIIDNYIQKNVEFRAESGLSEKIIRTSSGHCCEWCDKMAGTYMYPDVPKDVYRRHDNCDCTVEYVDGKVRQNVWTKKTRIASSGNEKDYKPVERGNIIRAKSKTVDVIAREIIGYNNMFITDATEIKPRALYNINKNINNAIEYYKENIRDRPRIVICAFEELGGTLGKYDELTDTLYLISQLGDRKNFTELQSVDKDIRFGYVEAHEIWHWKCTKIYGKNIDDIKEYNDWLNKKAKENIDKIGINAYNVGSISDYAFSSFQNGLFFEVEAEYITKSYMRRK